MVDLDGRLLHDGVSLIAAVVGHVGGDAVVRYCEREVLGRVSGFSGACGLVQCVARVKYEIVRGWLPEVSRHC